MEIMYGRDPNLVDHLNASFYSIEVNPLWARCELHALTVEQRRHCLELLWFHLLPQCRVIE